MTLVVGMKMAGCLHILSDTRISHPDVTQVEEIPGRLKIIIVHARLCIAYAGAADYAIDTIRDAARASAMSAVKAAQALREANVASGNAIEFLVGSIEPEATLLTIRAGRISEVDAEDCIGDTDSAAAYRRAKNGSGSLSDCLRAFSGVIANPALPCVGGLLVRAMSTTLGFIYADEATAYYPSQAIPSGVETPLRFGGPAEGGFAYTLLVPRIPGVPVVAVHFYQGRLGYVYAPLSTDRPVPIRDVDHESLRMEVLRRFGVELQGLRFG